MWAPFLGNLEFTLALENEIMGAILNDGMEPEAAAWSRCALFALNQGYWLATMQTLTLVLGSCLVCMAIGVPMGIWSAHNPRAYGWLVPVLDLMQTLPTFVYLIPVLVLFGLGMVPGLVATVIFALARRDPA
jgi:ABC-type proline/glycine betaine transport system permease subunit